MVKDLLQLLYQIFTTLIQDQNNVFSTSHNFSTLFPKLLSSFIHAQMKLWFPTRSPEEMSLYKSLLEMVIKSLMFPSIPKTIELLNCMSSLFPSEERGKNPEQEYVHPYRAI